MFDLKTRVLVVDDMSTMRKIVSKSLKNIGFTDIIDAADGVQAFTALQSSEIPVGLIVSDWNMPNCTGLEFLKRVRASNYKDVAFVLLTAESEIEQVKEAVAAGVDNYIVKPFTPAVLQQKLEETYKRRTAA